MPRRSLPAIPVFTANMAKAMGGAGYGIAEAGNQYAELGQSMIDNKLNQDKLSESKRQFDTAHALKQQKHKDNIGLGYFNANSANTRHSENLSQRQKELDYTVSNPIYKKATTDEGVYLVNSRNPSDKVRLGGFAHKPMNDSQISSMNLNNLKAEKIRKELGLLNSFSNPAQPKPKATPTGNPYYLDFMD